MASIIYLISYFNNNSVKSLQVGYLNFFLFNSSIPFDSHEFE